MFLSEKLYDYIDADTSTKEAFLNSIIEEFSFEQVFSTCQKELATHYMEEDEYDEIRQGLINKYTKCSFSICEDSWNDKEPLSGWGIILGKKETDQYEGRASEEVRRNVIYLLKLEAYDELEALIDDKYNYLTSDIILNKILVNFSEESKDFANIADALIFMYYIDVRESLKGFSSSNSLDDIISFTSNPSEFVDKITYKNIYTIGQNLIFYKEKIYANSLNLTKKGVDFLKKIYLCFYNVSNNYNLDTLTPMQQNLLSWPLTFLAEVVPFSMMGEIYSLVKENKDPLFYSSTRIKTNNWKEDVDTGIFSKTAFQIGLCIYDGMFQDDWGYCILRKFRIDISRTMTQATFFLGALSETKNEKTQVSYLRVLIRIFILLHFIYTDKLKEEDEASRQKKVIEFDNTLLRLFIDFEFKLSVVIPEFSKFKSMSIGGAESIYVGVNNYRYNDMFYDDVYRYIENVYTDKLSLESFIRCLAGCNIWSKGFTERLSDSDRELYIYELKKGIKGDYATKEHFYLDENFKVHEQKGIIPELLLKKYCEDNKDNVQMIIDYYLFSPLRLFVTLKSFVKIICDINEEYLDVLNNKLSEIPFSCKINFGDINRTKHLKAENQTAKYIEAIENVDSIASLSEAMKMSGNDMGNYDKPHNSDIVKLINPPFADSKDELLCHLDEASLEQKSSLMEDAEAVFCIQKITYENDNMEVYISKIS